jgi:hypothetical protein
MGKPTTLLEGLCGHARLLGAQSIEVEHKDGRQCVFFGNAIACAACSALIVRNFVRKFLNYS